MYFYTKKVEEGKRPPLPSNFREGIDILALDARNQSIPNIKIYDSYLIDDDTQIRAVCEIMIRYDSEHPSGGKEKWGRTLYWLEYEWRWHNNGATLGIANCYDADFDASAEGKRFWQWLD